MTIQNKHFSNAATNTLVLVSAQPCVLEMFEVSNVNNTDAFLQLFNASATASVTLGTTTPTQSFLIPAGDGTLRGVGAASLSSPFEFDTGIVYAVTTTPTGGVGPSSNTTINIRYR